MNILRDVIFELNAARPFGTVAIPELDTLRDLAIQRCRAKAEQATLYAADCIDLMTMFDEYEPDPAEVAEHLAAGDQGDWRKVLQKAAVFAVEAAFIADVERDLGILNEVFLEILAANFTVAGIFVTCPVGHRPHQSETPWKSGTLLRWTNPAETFLRMFLPAREPIWIRMAEIQ